jgi:thiamine biosynthesis lipoprotein
MQTVNQHDSPGEKIITPGKPFKPLFLIAALTVVVSILLICYYNRPAERLYQYYHVTMDTQVELLFFERSSRSAEQVSNAVFAEMERLENIFSRSLPESEISLINRSAGVEAVPVGHEMLSVANQANYYAQLSEGAFDPTIAPLIDLWGFLGQTYRVPSEAEIRAVLPLVNYSLVQIGNSRQSTIYLPEKKMALELGGIAKGYIIDRALDILIAAGVEHAYINAGGDIGLLGSKPGGTPWQIGVRHPREDNKIIAVLPVIGGAVVTSGDYQRAFVEKGIHYHHLLNSRSGMPARDLASVTIYAATALEADALSTTVFLLGPVKGLALIEEMPGVEGILITPAMEILISDGLAGLVELEP